MSVATIEQQALVVMTELADEEISGIVGGFGGPDVKTKTKTSTNIKGGNVQVSTQVGTAVANNGGNATVIQKSDQNIDNSSDRAYIGNSGYYPW